MNFFRKKGNIFASFSPSELAGDSKKFAINLMSLAPFESDMEVKLNVSDASDLPLNALSTMLAFANEIKERGAYLSLQVNPAVGANLRLLNMVSMFHSIEDKAG